jgi:hypothetical protein
MFPGSLHLPIKIVLSVSIRSAGNPEQPSVYVDLGLLQVFIVSTAGGDQLPLFVNTSINSALTAGKEAES